MLILNLVHSKFSIKLFHKALEVQALDCQRFWERRDNSAISSLRKNFWACPTSLQSLTFYCTHTAFLWFWKCSAFLWFWKCLCGIILWGDNYWNLGYQNIKYNPSNHIGPIFLQTIPIPVQAQKIWSWIGIIGSCDSNYSTFRLPWVHSLRRPSKNFFLFSMRVF